MSRECFTRDPKKYAHNIVAAAYVPAKHAYLPDKDFDRLDELQPILDKIFSPAPITIPKSYKNPLSDVFKKLRSRMGVKLYRDAL